jgi:hypothetical protein
MIQSPNATWWIGFTAVVVALLLVDLLVFHRKEHVVRPTEALGWSLFWIVLALVFNETVLSVAAIASILSISILLSLLFPKETGAGTYEPVGSTPELEPTE